MKDILDIFKIINILVKQLNGGVSVKFQTIKGHYIIGKAKKGDKSTFILLGDKSFSGNIAVFVDNENLDFEPEELDKVEVELTLTVKSERLKRGEEYDFFDVVTGKRVESIKKV